MPKQPPQHAAVEAPVDDAPVDDLDVDLEDVDMEGVPSLYEVALSFASRLPVALRDHDGAHERCFIQARKFIKAAVKARTGALWQESQCDPLTACLDDACAPNLPDDHPYNLASREKGSIEGLKRVLKMAETPKSAPDQYKQMIVAYGERLRARIPDDLLEQLLS